MDNYSILASHVLVPPAIEALVSDEECVVEGFLAAGHVCTIMGMKEYYPLVENFKVPIVITGFEPVDILQGILMTVQQLERGEAKLENQYARMVRENGNPKAMDTIYEVFEVTDRIDVKLQNDAQVAAAIASNEEIVPFASRLNYRLYRCTA